jgi:nucleotide-binding universal stress UspA family protein
MIIRKILAPIDFSERSREELRWATTLARNFGSELITLHVIPSEVVDLSLREGKNWDAIRGEVSAQTYLLVDEICRDLGVAGLVHEEHVVAGAAADEILHTIKHRGIDLVVISTHGRTGLSRTLLGSVVEKVVRSSPVPVLTLNEATMTSTV